MRSIVPAIFLSLAIATVAASVDIPSVSASQRFDILGLSLGMTPSEVEQTISSHHLALKVQEESRLSGGVGSIVGLRPGPNRDLIERVVVLFTDNGDKSWLVGHEIMFKKTEEPLRRTLQDSLIAKYGHVSGIVDWSNVWRLGWLSTHRVGSSRTFPHHLLVSYYQHIQMLPAQNEELGSEIGRLREEVLTWMCQDYSASCAASALLQI